MTIVTLSIYKKKMTNFKNLDKNSFSRETKSELNEFLETKNIYNQFFIYV